MAIREKKKQEIKTGASEREIKLGQKNKEWVKNRFRPCTSQVGYLILHKYPPARILVRNLY